MDRAVNPRSGKQKILKWTARGLALAILLFGLPFYFGYGNPLPFINPDYTLWDNLWLSVFPLMFLGLILGWFLPRAGGWLVVGSLTLGLLLGVILEGELVIHMLVPLLAGALFLVAGYAKKKEA